MLRATLTHNLVMPTTSMVIDQTSNAYSLSSWVWLTLPNRWWRSSADALMLMPFSVSPASAAKVVVGFHLPLFIGVDSSIILSTCSRDRPFISGTKKKTKLTQRRQSEPQMKKTLAPRLASPFPVPTRYGVMTAMIWIHGSASQCKAVFLRSESHLRSSRTSCWQWKAPHPENESAEGKFRRQQSTLKDPRSWRRQRC
jgi:hypothetical protein